jgi:hypothetical protein
MPNVDVIVPTDRFGRWSFGLPTEARNLDRAVITRGGRLDRSACSHKMIFTTFLVGLASAELPVSDCRDRKTPRKVRQKWC